MPPSLFALLTLALMSCSLKANTIEFADALRNNWISIEAGSTGALGADALYLKVTNLHKAMHLNIPAGWLFEAEDSTVQNLVLTQSVLLVLALDQKRSLRLDAFCINSGRMSPREADYYTSKGLVSGPLRELATYIHANKPDAESVQNAVWALSDNHNLFHIAHEGLLKSTAALLGKPIPDFFVRNGFRPEPGGPAFRYDPLSVEGMFEYEIEANQTLSFGLYTQEGELVQAFFENEERKAGRHRFRFTFRIRGIASGEYAIRLTEDSGRELGIRKVEW